MVHPGGTAPADGPDPDSARVTGLVGPEYLPQLLSYLREAVFIFDRNGDLKARLSPPGGLLGHGLDLGSNVFAHIHPDDVPRGLQFGPSPDGEHDDWHGEMRVRLRHADGTWRHFELRVWNRFADPAIEGTVGVLRALDTPGETHDPADEAPDATAGTMRETYSDELPTAYLALGREGRIRFASEAASALLGVPEEELVGLPIGELVADRDRPVVVAAYAALLDAPGSRTVVATTRNRFGGRLLEAELHTRGTDPAHKIVTVLLVDRNDEPELVRLATHDPLTGLANRTKVMDTLTGLLLAERHEPHLSVVYVDLDDLKAINDRHGHEVGDRALIEVGTRLLEVVRPTDLVGRMSGDEFVVVCPGLDGRGLMLLVERLGGEAGALRVAGADGGPVHLTVSAGGATAVAGDTPTSLLRRADEAMFAAKHGRA